MTEPRRGFREKVKKVGQRVKLGSGKEKETTEPDKYGKESTSSSGDASGVPSPSTLPPDLSTRIEPSATDSGPALSNKQAQSDAGAKAEVVSDPAHASLGPGGNIDTTLTLGATGVATTTTAEHALQNTPPIKEAGKSLTSPTRSDSMPDLCNAAVTSVAPSAITASSTKMGKAPAGRTAIPSPSTSGALTTRSQNAIAAPTANSAVVSVGVPGNANLPSSPSTDQAPEAAGSLRPGSSLVSARTSFWNQAIDSWNETPKGKAECKELEKLIADAPSNVESNNFFSQLQPEAKSSSKWRLRLKRCEPIINATRGIAVALANADPYKIAPLVVHSVYASLNILFNRMSPENTDKVLNILFGTSDIIRECISFELYFLQKDSLVVKDDMAAIAKTLPILYLRALRLMYEVQSSCKDVQREYSSSKEKWMDWIITRGSTLWRELTDKIAQWESEEQEIKRQAGRWTRQKKTMDEKLKTDEYNLGVRDWIRAEDDPEPTLESLKERLMPEGRYANAAQWFLASDAFLGWCATFQDPQSEEPEPESPDQPPTVASSYGVALTPNAQLSTVDQPDQSIQPATNDSSSGVLVTGPQNITKTPDPDKRVLWLRGGYGTGKTTVLYHTYDALETSLDLQLVDKKLRIVPYFCDASSTDEKKRPTHETIIRGMLWHMSLLPDFTLARAALKLYGDKKKSVLASGRKTELKDWELLFKNLISGTEQQYHFAIVVDALDECLSPADVGTFLMFMSTVLKAYSNVSLLCSSHVQVNVNDFFGADNRYIGQDILEVVDMTEDKSANDMKHFVNNELVCRKETAGESVFYDQGQQELRAELRELLLLHAQGMFRWVQIWLDILLPIHALDPTKTIISDELARNRLEQLRYDVTFKHDSYQKLEAGFQRLWDLNNLVDADVLGIRARLFHVVLASFDEQTPVTLSAMLRIRQNSYRDYPKPKDVERMCSNFLIYTQTTHGHKRLRFVDESAKRFVLNMSSTSVEQTEGAKTKLFSERNNHLGIAELYFQLIGSASHPYWHSAGLVPANWPDMLSGNNKTTRLIQDIKSWRAVEQIRNPPFHIYLSRFGLGHCGGAAEKWSIYDPVWRKAIEQVLLSPNSAYPFVMLAKENAESIDHNFFRSGLPGNWIMFREENERLRFLPSHSLALLDMFRMEDVPRLEEALALLKANPEKISASFENRLFQDAACIGGAFSLPHGYLSEQAKELDAEVGDGSSVADPGDDVSGVSSTDDDDDDDDDSNDDNSTGDDSASDALGLGPKHLKVTALQLGCVLGNRATVHIILEALATLAPEAAYQLLFTDTASFAFPFCIIMAYGDIQRRLDENQLARPLLEFEMKFLSSTKTRTPSFPIIGVPVSQQIPETNKKVHPVSSAALQITQRVKLIMVFGFFSNIAHVFLFTLRQIAQVLLIFAKNFYRSFRAESSEADHSLGKSQALPFISRQWSLIHNKDMDPALHIGACRHRGDRLIKLLRFAPAQDINLQAQEGWTALHFAAGAGNFDVVCGLVDDFGAAVDPVSSDGRTPVQNAFHNGHVRVFEYLKSKGADTGFIAEDLDGPEFNFDGLIDAIFEQDDW